MMRTSIAVLLAAALVFSSTAAFGAGDAGRRDTRPAEEPATILVCFRAPLAAQDDSPAASSARRLRDRAHQRAGGRYARPLRAVPGLEVVEVPEGTSAAALIARYEAEPDVLYAEPDAAIELADVPDDALFGQQWALDNAGQRGGKPGADIGALEAWEVTRGEDHVIVAVIDTGVDYTHEDLAPNMWPGIGYDFYYDTRYPTDGTTGHGTHIAGTIAAATGDAFGTTGVAPGVQIMALKVFNDAGAKTSVSFILQAIEFAEENGARIINASWGTPVHSASLRLAIEESPALFVAAAGNAGQDTSDAPFYPAVWSSVLDNVISVSATDRFDELAAFSNYGSATDIAAPGAGILSSVPGRQRVVYHESFSDPDSWVAEFHNTTSWGLSELHFTSTPYSLADSPNGDYANDEDSAVRMRDPVSLLGVSAPFLRFEMLLESESGADGVWLEASTDSSTWQSLSPRPWSGSTSGEFATFAENLSAYAGEPELWLRFRFTSDETTTSAGAYIDDLRIVAPGTHGPSNRHGDKSGTSMATPHVTGVAALLKSYNHLLRPAELRDVICESAEALDSLEGRVRTGGRLDAAAAVAAVEEGPPPAIVIQGATRYDTAVKASQVAYPDGLDTGGPRTVVLATGRNWPDALGGTALAGVLDGPLLLVGTNTVPQTVIEEIERLGAVRAILLGGKSAVSAAVEDLLAGELAEGVERIAGATRYDTADEVAKRVVAEQGGTFGGTAIVATGGTFADGVAAAPLAAGNGWPLYLSRPTSGLRTATVEAMGDADVSRVLLLGGSQAISLQTEEGLKEEFGSDGVVRLKGVDRYETAARIAAWAVDEAGHSWDRVGLATGRSYPDALTGGVVQGRAGSVLLLTSPTALTGTARDVLSANRQQVGTVTYFGGPQALRHGVRMGVLQALEW